MEKAESLYLAGEFIYANDERLNYESYKKFGLRCLSCGEPVFLKKGDKNIPHFAHFPGTDPEQVEECEIRVTDYSNNQGYGDFEAALYEDKSQRLKIFQKQFLNIFAKQYPDFSDQESYYEKLQFDNNVLNKCIEWFINNEKAIKEIYPLSTSYVKHEKAQAIFSSHNNNVDIESIYAKKSFFEKRVFHQVIDYLCTKSSYESLKKLIYYSHSKCNSTDHLLICRQLLNLLLKVCWSFALQGIVTKEKKIKVNCTAISTAKQTKTKIKWGSKAADKFQGSIDNYQQYSRKFKDANISPFDLAFRLDLRGVLSLVRFTPRGIELVDILCEITEITKRQHFTLLPEYAHLTQDVEYLFKKNLVSHKTVRVSGNFIKHWSNSPDYANKEYVIIGKIEISNFVHLQHTFITDDTCYLALSERIDDWLLSDTKQLQAIKVDIQAKAPEPIGWQYEKKKVLNEKPPHPKLRQPKITK